MRYEYKVRAELRPKGLTGISESQIAQHWSLYEGYVKNVDLLNEKLAALSAKGDFGPEFAELKRHLGFEYDGMILHEHYFGVLKAGSRPLAEQETLSLAMKESFGGHAEWLAEFSAMGKMRGVGWVIVYYDPLARALTNHWIGLHDGGHPAGFLPILVMDVWEHAYMVDAGVAGRPAYIDAFLANVDWPAVEKVYRAAAHMPDAVTRKEKKMDKTPEVKVITKDALNEKISKGESFQLVNVLDPKYYELGIIKGSLKIPAADLEKRSGELDKAKDVVTYCADTSCSASRTAATLLAAKGFKVSAYEGGIKEWTAAKLPVEAAPAPVAAVAAKA